LEPSAEIDDIECSPPNNGYQRKARLVNGVSRARRRFVAGRFSTERQPAKGRFGQKPRVSQSNGLPCLDFRVNLGDAIVDGGDIFVYEQVRNKLDLDYRPLGSHRVKNIAEPVRAWPLL
jgi:hypothetical protein